MRPAFAPGRRLAFAKPGRDGSGKATLLPAPGARVCGALYAIDPADLPALDHAEDLGTGYDRIDRFSVETTDGPARAMTYLACAPRPELLPYDWYLALVVAGAREIDLEAGYVAGLARHPYSADKRETCGFRNAALDALKAAGIENVETVFEMARAAN